MSQTPNYIVGLLENPVESYKVELKAWMDPDEDKVKAKIVKTCLALRNQDGGVLLVGVSDDGERMPACPFPKVRETYNQEKIQQLVAHHSGQAFEIQVWFVPMDQVEYVAIEVSSGLRYPVVSKRALSIQGASTKLVHENTIYVRTLNQNGVVSTAALSHKDIQDVFDRCFENREADIGNLLRKHLTPGNVRVIRDAFRFTHPEEELGQPEAALELRNLSSALKTTIQNKMDAWHSRYSERANEREDIPVHGAFEVGVVLGNPGKTFRATQQFRTQLLARNPSYTGWPIWLDSSGFSNQASRPKVHADGWEAFIASFGESFSSHLDYWYLSGTGEFYLRRALQDDIGSSGYGPEPLTELDFGLAILRTAESILVTIEFARMFELPEDSEIVMGFRWTGLKQRFLTSWANPERQLYQNSQALDDSATSTVSIPSITPKSSTPEFVKKAVEPLFLKFEGWECPDVVVEDFVSKLIEKRL